MRQIKDGNVEIEPIQEKVNDFVKKRTLKQNNSLHLGCQQIADELIAHGISLEIALRGLDIRPTMESIKDVYKQIAEAKFGVTSTTNLTTRQVNEVWVDLTKALSQNTGVEFNFPSYHSTEEALQAFNQFNK